ncbi:MAG: rRNA pseudouridine synthase [Clostridia bacterium]|nr:rRNA pseudouridine synthase [Clostridia bacterium]
MERRLQKYLADCGVASRRAAEALITEGRVTVNGETAELGCKVGDNDRVLLDGRPVVEKRRGFTYVMLHKPRGYITTMKDEEGRRCVADLLEGLRARVVPVGRLDRNSEGLLLLTDDGDLTYALTHPAHDVQKRYLATFGEELTEERLEALRAVKTLDGVPLKAVTIELLKKEPERTVLRFTLTEGKNRQIRRMCEQAGLKVIRLKRVSVANLRLAGLKSGQWRHLTEEELEGLKKAAAVLAPVRRTGR